jgi:hypothetical protein
VELDAVAVGRHDHDWEMVLICAGVISSGGVWGSLGAALACGFFFFAFVFGGVSLDAAISVAPSPFSSFLRPHRSHRSLCCPCQS